AVDLPPDLPVRELDLQAAVRHRLVTFDRQATGRFECLRGALPRPHLLGADAVNAAIVATLAAVVAASIVLPRCCIVGPGRGRACFQCGLEAGDALGVTRGSATAFHRGRIGEGNRHHQDTGKQTGGNATRRLTQASRRFTHRSQTRFIDRRFVDDRLPAVAVVASLRLSRPRRRSIGTLSAAVTDARLRELQGLPSAADYSTSSAAVAGGARMPRRLNAVARLLLRKRRFRSIRPWRRRDDQAPDEGQTDGHSRAPARAGETDT